MLLKQYSLYSGLREQMKSLCSNLVAVTQQDKKAGLLVIL